MCKPNKFGHGNEHEIGHTGFSRHVKREKLALIDLREAA
jgi:hypothetical protein